MFLLFFLFFSNILNLEDLLKIAKENSPYLLSLENEWEAKKEEILPLSALPNPTFETMYENVGKAEMSMLNFKVGQNLLYFGKRKILKNIAEENALLSFSYLKIAEAEISKRIREIYSELYFLNYQKKGFQEAIELLNSLKVSLTGLLETGFISQENFLKIDTTLLKLNEKIKENEAEYFTLIKEIERLLGNTIELKDFKVDLLPKINLQENLEEKALNNSPILNYFEKLLSLKEKELKKNKLDLKPNIYAFSSIGLKEGFGPVFTIGGAVEFPFWKKEKEIPLINAKEKEIESAKSALHEAKLKVLEEIKSTKERIKKFEERLKIYREGYLPFSSKGIEAAISLYISGKGDFSTVIENINLWVEGKVEVSNLEAEKFKNFSKILFHTEE